MTATADAWQGWIWAGARTNSASGSWGHAHVPRARFSLQCLRQGVQPADGSFLTLTRIRQRPEQLCFCLITWHERHGIRTPVSGHRCGEACAVWQACVQQPEACMIDSSVIFTLSHAGPVRQHVHHRRQRPRQSATSFTMSQIPQHATAALQLFRSGVSMSLILIPICLPLCTLPTGPRVRRSQGRSRHW
jgi:hypothetical protein